MNLPAWLFGLVCLFLILILAPWCVVFFQAELIVGITDLDIANASSRHVELCVG